MTQNWSNKNPIKLQVSPELKLILVNFSHSRFRNHLASLIDHSMISMPVVNVLLTEDFDSQ